MRSRTMLFTGFCGVFGVVLAMAAGSLVPILWGKPESNTTEEYKIILHQTALIEPSMTSIAPDSDMVKNYLSTGETMSLWPLELKIGRWVAEGYEVAHFSSCAITIDSNESEIVYTVLLRRVPSN